MLGNAGKWRGWYRSLERQVQEICKQDVDVAGFLQLLIATFSKTTLNALTQYNQISLDSQHKDCIIDVLQELRMVPLWKMLVQDLPTDESKLIGDADMIALVMFGFANLLPKSCKITGELQQLMDVQNLSDNLKVEIQAMENVLMGLKGLCQCSTEPHCDGGNHTPDTTTKHSCCTK